MESMFIEKRTSSPGEEEKSHQWKREDQLLLGSALHLQVSIGCCISGYRIELQGLEETVLLNKMAASGGTQQSFRKALGALKDSTKYLEVMPATSSRR
ncbi:hypothetical protein LOK49_LG06G02199 [Camellia lanceoleosa]|uniref:Uncharacterized protein n=1 Tax=Camellia lanceoleosa TaxID=1840588 RepID=A0ACC0HEW4_9ERIC|nr:hypothetical protein LOK49_LG06G02199 [Camellia lanceoleosa]